MSRGRTVLCRWIACIGVVVALLTVSHSAQATNKAAAESLFTAGQEAMERGDYETACQRFAASMEAEASVGAMLNLARCHQKVGKDASAWAEFREAAAMARRAGQPSREEGALQYAAELEARLSKLTIDVPAPVAGLKVTRNGADVPAGSFGTAVPVDPGTHVIEASAPGHESWRGEIAVGPNADTLTVTVPELAPGAGVAAGPGSDGGGMTGREIAGWVIAGAGVVGVGIGSALGIVAMGKTDDLE